MSNERRNQLIAALATLLIAVLLIVTICCLTLTYSPATGEKAERQTWPPTDSTELLFAGEFVQLGDIPQSTESTEPAPTQESAQTATDADVSPQQPSDIAPLTNNGVKTATTEKPVATPKPAENKEPAAKPAEQPRPDIKKVTFNKPGTAANNQSGTGGTGAGKPGSPDGNADHGALSGSVGTSMAGRSISVSAPQVSSSESLDGRRVVVEIVVDRDGKQLQAPAVVEAQTTVKDPQVRQRCLQQAARARVSAAPQAAPRQRGTITFRFSRR